MMFDMLLIFIMVIIFLFVFIIFFLFVDETSSLEGGGGSIHEGRHIGNWRAAIPLITINMIFCVLVAYGFYNIEFFLSGADLTGDIYSTTASNYDVFAYVFMLFFFIHIILFFLCGWYSWLDALTTEGRIKYTRR